LSSRTPKDVGQYSQFIKYCFNISQAGICSVFMDLGTRLVESATLEYTQTGSARE